jgi:carbonic anhydrase/acetyltransferase-like protein (isoleucine patch superfamily)
MYKDVTIVPFNGKSPQIHPSAFIAPGCRIIGDVEIGPEVSIWYNCVIRADVNRVVIGARTNVQDGTVIHCDSPDPTQPAGWPTIIGEDCLIGHLAMVHGATLENNAFVGLSATVMNGCVIEEDGMVAAGALLSPNKRVGKGQMWIGRPAKYLRDLSPAEIADNRYGVVKYIANGKAHKAALEGL